MIFSADTNRIIKIDVYLASLRSVPLRCAPFRLIWVRLDWIEI